MEWLEANSLWPITVSCLSIEKIDYNSEHTVAYGENVKHPAILYCADGCRDYLDASVNGIRKVLDKCLQRTGAPVSNFEYLGPVGSTCETEYCNFATYANTFVWMSMITADTEYGDLLEKIVFNGAEGVRKKDEKAINYMSLPNQVFATSNSTAYGRSDMQAYAPVYDVACCPAQFVRVIPEWCSALSVIINGGAPEQNVLPGSFYPVSRTWNDGDSVTLRFPMEIKAIEGHPFTTLPEGWSWYETSPESRILQLAGGWDMSGRFNLFMWNYALVKSELPQAGVIEYDSHGYPWEDSPVKIRVAMRMAKYCYPPYPSKTKEIYENPIETRKESEYIELVLYGCTTLRISYFPAAKEM